MVAHRHSEDGLTCDFLPAPTCEHVLEARQTCITQHRVLLGRHLSAQQQYKGAGPRPIALCIYHHLTLRYSFNSPTKMGVPVVTGYYRFSDVFFEW